MQFHASIIQFSPVLSDPEKNISIIKELLDKTGDARLVVLPELANSGYNFINRDQAYSLSEDLQDSPYLTFLAGQAKARNSFIVSGICEKDKDDLFNTAILVGPEGFLGKYRKIHLFMNEKDFFKPGDSELPVFDTSFGKVGILICFDYLFPEVWRILAMKGADIICHPANLITANAHKVVPALALMNRIYIMTANRTGTDRNLTFFGRSFITDPSGNIIKMADEQSAGIISTEIDPLLSRNKMITPRNHVFNDRLPDRYVP
jgi:predicted amidohydrolase